LVLLMPSIVQAVCLEVRKLAQQNLIHVVMGWQLTRANNNGFKNCQPE